VLAYILLDNSAGVITNYLAYNNTGVFNREDANYDEIYYIFTVTGPDNNDDDLPDLDDANVDISSNSTEVTFIYPSDFPSTGNYYCKEDTASTVVMNNCGNSAGKMPGGVFEVCFGDFAVTKVNNDSIESGYELFYVMHDSASTDSIGNIIAINKTGIFHNDGSLPFNQDLFISAYVGPLDTNDMPVLTDPCASVALPGTVFRFFKAIELVEVNQQCDLQTGAVDITFYLTGGLPEFPFPFGSFHEYHIVGDYFGVIDEPYDELIINLFDVNTYEIETTGNNCKQIFLMDITCDTLNNVWPGDVNKNGIVNNEDIAILGIYAGETGPERSYEDQNSDWYAHQASEWNIQQANGQNIKHFDCNGDGIINDLDLVAIQTWYGKTHTDFQKQDTVFTTDSFNYKILLQPIGEIINDSLVINVAMENEDTTALNLQGAFFTIDYSNILSEVYTAKLDFLSTSWLGTNNDNLYTFTKKIFGEKKIEAAFTKTDGTNSVGSGVIAQLILTFDSSSNCSPSAFNNATVEIHTAGANNTAGSLIPLENQLLQINNQTTNTCQQGWQITKDTPFQNVYKTSSTIETVGNIIIGTQQQVSYQAGRVSLNSGFKLKEGAEFHAGSSDCDNGGVIPDPDK